MTINNHLTPGAYIRRWRKSMNEMCVLLVWEYAVNVAACTLVGFVLGLVLSPLWRAWS